VVHLTLSPNSGKDIPVRTSSIVIPSLCSLLLAAVSYCPAPGADLAPLVAEAAKYESGQSVEPIQKIEQLVRDALNNPALRPQLEAAMIKLVGPGSTFEARRFGCQILAAIGTEASLPVLTQMLNQEETVGIACLALSSERFPKSAATLRAALPAARGLARLQIISALGNHRDGQSVDALAKLARDADRDVAAMAIRALGKIGTKAAQAAVAELAKQPPAGQGCAVTEARLRMARQLASADPKAAVAIYSELLGSKFPNQVRRGALGALLRLDADGGQQRILDTLASRDPVLTAVAIARIGELKALDASARFAGLLGQLPPAAQVWMIEALASRRDAAARQAILARLSASDADVRRAAIAAVGRLEEAPAVPLLVNILAAGKSPEEAPDAELALAALRGGAATNQALVAELKKASPAVKVRLFSVLARRGVRTAVPALLVEASSTDPETAQAAFLTLGRLTTAADVPAVLEKLVSLKAADARSDAESAAARAIAKIADARHRSDAVRALLPKTVDLEARGSLLRLLPVAADPAALAALVAAAGDKDPQLRDAAVRALATWPDATGWDALLGIFQKPENNRHRALALRALVRLAGDLNAKPDAALIGRYRQLLAGAQTADDRRLVLSALAGANDPAALDLALSALSDPAVRAETELTVRKIAAKVRAEHPEAAQAALAKLKPAKKAAPKK
jgi:HEAT repeat protein